MAKKKRVRKPTYDKKRSTENHLRMSIEDWRLKKRQEWWAVVHALELFSYGSAYTPTGNDLYEMEKAANRIKESMADDWVCW